MTFNEWMGAGYSDRMTGLEALRAAYEAGRKAGIEEAVEELREYGDRFAATIATLRALLEKPE